MGRVVAMFMLFMLPFAAEANLIDSLKTIEDIQRFLIEKVDTNLKHERGFIDGISKAHKMDVDSNGLTDMLLDAIYPFEDNSYVVMDLGDRNYQLCYLTRFIGLLHDRNQPLLVVAGNMANNQKIDTLIYKFGGFIEYNDKPEKVVIEELNFESTMNWETGANFELNIDSTRWAKYVRPGGANFKIFAGEIDSASFDEINRIVGYMRLVKMSNNYPLAGADMMTTDQPSCNLEVKFTDGGVKKIYDYGEQGTYGLRILYRRLLDLAENLTEY